MSELLESVKRLAEYQERTGTQLTLNYIALAKHIAWLERVEVAAKEYRKRYLAHTDHTSIHVLMAGDALDAALNNLKPEHNDGK